MFFLLIPFVLYMIFKKMFFGTKSTSIEGKHVVITGGSSGIGKSLAIIVAQRGAHVTILARNLQQLLTAQAEIMKHRQNDSQKVLAYSLDVSNFEDVEIKMNLVEQEGGPIFMLVNCAGLAVCGKLEDISVDNIKKMTDINYLGTMYCIKAVVSKLKARKEGIIVLTASQAALLGIFGYSAYAASKYALRGIAESLDMEVRPYNVSVTLSLPPDTDTPGYEEESKSKPIETALISSTAGLFKPDSVAKQLLDDALNKKFYSYVGLESFMLSTLCVGMSPPSSFLQVIFEAVLLGPMRILSYFYLNSFHKIVFKQATIDKKEE